MTHYITFLNKLTILLDYFKIFYSAIYSVLFSIQSVLFCSFYFILFCLFCSVLFCFVCFYFLLYSIYFKDTKYYSLHKCTTITTGLPIQFFICFLLPKQNTIFFFFFFHQILFIKSNYKEYHTIISK